jgi:hypothetical protein
MSMRNLRVTLDGISEGEPLCGDDLYRRIGLDGIEDPCRRKECTKRPILRAHDIKIDDNAGSRRTALNQKAIDPFGVDRAYRSATPRTGIR